LVSTKNGEDGAYPPACQQRQVEARPPLHPGCTNQFTEPAPRPILLLVDILSRKARAYVLTKSKKEKRAEVNVAVLKEFKNEVQYMKGIV
jgi:hypothetical protein